MPRTHRSLASLILLVALAATLLFAATAAAEIKIGEGTSPEDPTLEHGEADLLKATATYDSTTGTATFELTTRQAPESTPEEERPSITYLAVPVTSTIPCSLAGFEAEAKREQKEEEETGKRTESSLYPAFELLSPNSLVTTSPFPNVPVAQAYGAFLTHQPTGGPFGENIIPGTKTASGNTITISATTAQASNAAFNCAEVAAEDSSGGPSGPDTIIFPLTTKPEPPPVEPPATPKPAPAPAAKPAPSPAPGVLSIAAAKPVNLAVGKWTTVKLTVTNTGGSTITQGSLAVKAPKGVVVKPLRQKLPALLPGDSWTVSARVQLTAKARKTSRIAWTATAGGLSAGGSLVLKLKG